MFSLVPWRREREKGGLATRTADPFNLMRREFDTLFDRFFGRLPSTFAEDWEVPTWGLDMTEEEKEVVIRAEAPGFEVADFDVRVVGDTLTIIAEHKEDKEKADKKDGRAYVRLERSVTLPSYADTEKIEAVYRNGVLELRLPKLPEAAGRKVEVKA